MFSFNSTEEKPVMKLTTFRTTRDRKNEFALLAEETNDNVHQSKDESVLRSPRKGEMKLVIS